MTRAYGIFHATEQADLEACIRLRVEASEWLRSAGIAQWENLETGRRVLTQAFDKGLLFVVKQDGDVVACLRLDGPDLHFWNLEEAQEPALYLYKFMITRAHQGTGLADALLDWACEKAEDIGADVLRLDCRRDNRDLQRYWESKGFQHYATRRAAGRDSGWLGQRPAAERRASGLVTVIDGTRIPAHDLPISSDKVA